jgi:hypothetical protein
MKQFLILSVIGLASTATALATNIVTNPSFDTADFSGWTVNLASDHPWQIRSGGAGSFYAANGCVGQQCIGSDTSSATAYLYQDLATVAGDTYTIDFFFASGGAPGQELLVTFGGTKLFDLVDLNPGGYAEYCATAVASGTTTRLEFQGRQDPGFNSLDNISVTRPDASAPEPSSIVMALTGAFGLFIVAGFRRRLSATR